MMSLLTGILIATSAWAYDPAARPEVASHVVPEEIENVGVTERLGQQLDLNLEFTNEAGQTVPLKTYFNGSRPVLLAMVYYTCPNLCNFQLNGLVDVFKKTQAKLGKDFDLVAVSMNHNETPDVAGKKKENYLKALGIPGAETGWHFLVGNEPNVKTLADQLGFKFKWNEASQQYAHAAVSYIVTPSGMISRYLYGIDFSPQTLRLSLVEASEGKIGNIIDQIILFCFQFNPAKNKYTLYAWNLMQIGAALTVVLLGLFLIPVWMKEKQRQAV